jgi:hypothetical protein
MSEQPGYFESKARARRALDKALRALVKWHHAYDDGMGEGDSDVMCDEALTAMSEVVPELETLVPANARVTRPL